jgi:hypothetical protein
MALLDPEIRQIAPDDFRNGGGQEKKKSLQFEHYLASPPLFAVIQWPGIF